jgi:hypothetical protein
MQICRESPNLVKNGQKCRTGYMETQVRSTVASDITSPKKRSIRLKRYQTVVPSVTAAISAFISASPNGRIYVKFYAGDVHHNLLRNPTFG